MPQSRRSLFRKIQASNVRTLRLCPVRHRPAGAGGFAGTLIGIAPLLLIFVAFYFLLIRPQQKRMKTLQASIAAVKRGDTVVTSGGILGRVTKVEDAIVEVEIAANTRVRVVKATIAEITTPTGAKPAND